jgi:hypothetical protein
MGGGSSSAEKQNSEAKTEKKNGKQNRMVDPINVEVFAFIHKS